MPTFRGQGDAPVVQFDPTVEVSPFTLFRQLAAGSAPELRDVRPKPDDRSLAGAQATDEAWRPATEESEVVLFDDNGTIAVDRARGLQAEGFLRVRALFGGLDLYEFSLDPEVVGSETFLLRAEGDSQQDP